MAHDVSKMTIMVLLVLTILVSVLGAWTLMSSLSSANVKEAPVQEVTPNGAGYVNINIVRPETSEPETSEAEGTVNLDIVN